MSSEKPEAPWVRLEHLKLYALQAQGLRLEIERGDGPRPWVWRVLTLEGRGLVNQGRARTLGEAKRLAAHYGRMAKARLEADDD